MDNNINKPILLNVQEAANYLQVSTRFIREQIKRGNLSFLKLGNRYRFSPADLQKWIDTQKVNAVN